ncbi:T9SS type A sorting domain-containing protein, partial [bacterium BMS3Abin03]|nr:T9SS type A sorting domain-containing protein [bacterium BMS3Abin03]
TGGGIIRSVTVTQAERPTILTVTPSNQFVTYGSGSKTFTVESNINWTVSDNAAWLTVDPTSGDSNGTLIAIYSENTTASQRIGTITVTGGGISRTVTVTQSVSTITLIYDYKFADPQSTSNYQMIGLPGANNLLVSSVITGTPGKDGDWRAFWDSGNLPLTEYDGNNEFYFKPGRAFWIISRYSIDINLSVSPVQLAADNTFSIQLHPGWNLISNPFNKALSWSSVISVNGGNLQPIYSFESGNYVNTSSFEPFKGYYFFNNDSLASIKIPYSSAKISPKQNFVSSKEMKMFLTLNGNPKSEINVGFSDDAKNGVDKLDIFSPPSLFCNVNMSLYSDEIETDYKYLQEEFRPGIGEGQDYNIFITNTSNKTLKLATEGLENFSGYEVYLLDKDLVKIYDLRKQNKIEVPKNISGKEYELYIGTEEYISEKKDNLIPFEYALYQNFPNPFNAETQIMFAMPRQGKVSLVIYNILGEVIAEVITDQFFEAGYHHVSVDFGNFSSGIYLYKLQTEFSDSQSFTKTKKMILLK